MANQKTASFGVGLRDRMCRIAAGLLAGAVCATFAVMPVTAGPADSSGYAVLFDDDFSSYGLDAGDWKAQNANCSVICIACWEGRCGAQLRQSCWIERSISTRGFRGIQLSYARRTANMEPGEALHVEWWDGYSWKLLESTRRTTFGYRTWTLPSAASNNENFRIRFRVAANRADEVGEVDSVVVSGYAIK